ncbi:SAM-dependent methyltransferase, partial [Candidatus Woesearchaeota archaeon]|nr:SAM-dependent methyltransferase [Candidatus Woesearchaeota archaeon]
NDEIKKFSDNFFHSIIHDPPRFSLAGELYGAEFYEELYRVAKPEAKFYHYVGDPGGKAGKDLVAGCMRRLQHAGFSNLRRRHYGIVGRK